MSTFDTASWVQMITKVKNDLLSYMENVNEELLDDIEVKEKVDGDLKVLDKIKKVKLKSDSIEEIIESIAKIDEITAKLSEAVTLVSNHQYIKSIQRTMSDTYFENILRQNKEIIKGADKVEKWVSNKIDEVIDEVSSVAIKDISIKDIYTIYSKNITANNTKIFLKLLTEYKSKGKDISEVVERIKDSVLGYNGQQFNKHPFCDHPLLLMGSSFNLYASDPREFHTKDDIKKMTESSILVDNSLNKATTTTIYDLNSLLFGAYRQIKKSHSISLQSIRACRTIFMMTKLPSSHKNSGIVDRINKTDSRTIIYESMDGTNYRRMKPTLPTDSAPNIRIGPKPRVHLYNERCSDVMIEKKDVFLTKTPQVGNKYIDVTKWRKIKTVNDVLKEIGSSKKNREAAIYSIVIANTLLKNYKKAKPRKTEAGEEIKINQEDYLIKELI